MYHYFEFDFENAAFEWDPAKDITNFNRHGVHFKTALRVFKDQYKIIREDEEHRQEERYNVLGKVGKVFFVVCIFKEGNVVRIISARHASLPERKRYELGPDDSSRLA